MVTCSDGRRHAADIVQGYISRGKGWMGGPADAFTRERRESKLLGEAARVSDPCRRALVEAIGPQACAGTVRKACELQLTRAAVAAERGAWREVLADLAAANRLHGADGVLLARVQRAVQARVDNRPEAFYENLRLARAMESPLIQPLWATLLRIAVSEDGPGGLQHTLRAVACENARDVSFWVGVLACVPPTAFIDLVGSHPQGPVLSILALSAALSRSCGEGLAEAQHTTALAQSLFQGPEHALFSVALAHIEKALAHRACGGLADFYREIDTAWRGIPDIVEAPLLGALRVVMAEDVADTDRVHGLMASLPTSPRLQRDGKVALAWLETATQVGRNDLRATLLDLGVGFVPPAQLVWDMTPDLLNQARERRWRILYYGVVNKSNQCVLSPDFCEPLWDYEFLDIPSGHEVEGLIGLTERGWNALGADFQEGAMRVVAYAGDNAIHDYRIERHAQFGVGLQDISARGIRLVTALSGRSGECLYLVDHAQRGVKYDWRSIQCGWGTARAVELAIREALAQGANLCASGASHDAQKKRQLLFALPGETVSSSYNAMDAVDAAAQSVRSALVNGAWARAAEAIEQLPGVTRVWRQQGWSGRTKHVEMNRAEMATHANPWVRHASMFADIISRRTSEPWSCMLDLAGVALAEGSVHDIGLGTAKFSCDTVRIIRFIWQDCSQQLRYEALQKARGVRKQDPDIRYVLAAAIGDMFRDLNLNWMSADGGLSSLLKELLVRAVDRNDPSHACLLVRLGADAGEAGKSGTSPQEIVVKSGRLWMSEALRGNAAAGREAFRMGPVQRKTLMERASAAEKLSRAQTAALDARLLAMGYEPYEGENLREYLRHAAPLWINFVPACTNGLLRAETYRPKGNGSAAWAHGYAQALPRESDVIYGWVNAQKALAGYTSFGEAALVLEDHMRARITVTSRTRRSEVDAVGTLHAMDHVLMDLSDMALHAIIFAMQNTTKIRPNYVQSADVIEMHIHGPLHMREDVRKITIDAGAVLPEEAHAALHDFAEQNGLAIHWRGDMRIKWDERAAWLERLSHQSVNVAAWSFYPHEGFCVRPGSTQSADAQGRHAYVYGEQVASPERLTKIVATIGLSGEDVIGMHMTKNPGSGGHTTLITRMHTRDRAPRTYALYRTQLATERLAALGAQQWELMACERVGGDVSVTPDTYFVVRQSEKRWEYAWETLAKDGRNAAYNLSAQGARAGWALAGMTLRSQNDPTCLFVFKRALDEDVSLPELPPIPQTVVNASTMMLVPLASVPEALRFVTQDHYMFDIEELATLAEEKGALINGWTNSPLSEADVAAVLAHPSGTGARLASMVASNDLLLRRLQPATAAALDTLAAILKVDPTEGDMHRSVRATHAFSSYVNSSQVSADERVAIYGAKFALVNTQGQVFHLSIMAAVAGLQTGAGCSIATGRYLQHMAAQIRGLLDGQNG